MEFGAVSCYKATITNSNFINNNAKGIFDGDDYVSWGGAISSYYCNADNCNFEKNKALNYGGAIETFFCNLSNCNFKQNAVQYDGGAIFCHEGYNIVNSNFISNTAKYSSGGAIHGNGDVGGYVKDCVFKQNTAGDEGGAIKGSVFAVNSLFEKNIATYAGAIHSIYNITVNNCTFKSNNEAAIIAHGASINNQKKYAGKVILDNSLKSISLINVNINKFTTTYMSGKTLKIKLTTAVSNKPAKNLGVKVTLYLNKKDVTSKYLSERYLYTNKNGEIVLKASKWPVGKYVIKLVEGYEHYSDGLFVCPIPETSTNAKISKAKTTVKAPKVTAKYKKSKYFKVTVKNKATKKVVKKLKLKVKVFTGKKYKTYTIKTNKKGVAKLNTKKLKRGKHKVKITSKNKNYKVSKKSTIKIK